MTTVLKSDTDGKLVHVEEQISQWADRLIESGDLLPLAVQDAVIHAHRFAILNGRLIDKVSGVDFNVVMDELLKERPHWRPIRITDSAAAAWGDKRSLAAMGERLRELVAEHGAREGRALYEQEAAQWQCSVSNLKAGVKPAGKDETSKKRATFESDHRANPWLHDSAENTAERIRIIKVLGTKKAAELARAVGKTITGQALRV